MQLVLQPCGDPDALEHFVDTVENKVALSRILPFLPEAERKPVADAFRDSVAVWGVTPGEGGVNARKWARMQPGDVALMYRNKRFFHKGEVSYKVHAPDLARELWQSRADGTTWEYVFFLTALEGVDIDIARFNAVAGYKPNYVVQSFNVLAPDKSESILDALDLDLPSGVVLPAAIDLEAEIRALAERPAGLDRPVKASRRVEQAQLRKIHFRGKDTAICSICAKPLPVDLLVVGHIRKRHSCDDRQRLDLANTMPICLLGCDSLFEKGYLYVDATGTIRASGENPAASPLDAAVRAVAGRSCPAWTADADRFFRWHREHSRRIG